MIRQWIRCDLGGHQDQARIGFKLLMWWRMQAGKSSILRGTSTYHHRAAGTDGSLARKNNWENKREKEGREPSRLPQDYDEVGKRA